MPMPIKNDKIIKPISEMMPIPAKPRLNRLLVPYAVGKHSLLVLDHLLLRNPNTDDADFSPLSDPKGKHFDRYFCLQGREERLTGAPV